MELAETKDVFLEDADGLRIFKS